MPIGQSYGCAVILWLIFLHVVSVECDLFPPRLIPIPTTTKHETNLTFFHVDHHEVYVLSTTQHVSVLLHHPLQKTSKQQSCLYATNAGPFHGDGTPVGVVMVDGSFRSLDFDWQGVGFGRTTDNMWVFATLENITQANDIGLVDFVTGFDWLVYNGKNVANTNATIIKNRTGAKRAPRTAVGVDHEGRLLLVVADGCQRCLFFQGPTLTEMANLMIARMGAVYAINMDGGGSSVLVEKGRVKSHPTCLDLPLQCERPVATVMCIR
jgi:exopolysaccharide biosynthesis protein